MLPQEIIESGLDDGCVRLYAYISRACGPDGSWTVAGATEIGDRIEMQPGTLLGHARHLSEFRLIDYEREGRRKYSFRMLHNASMGLTNPDAQVPPPRPLAKKRSKYSAPVPRSSRVVEARSSRVSTLDQRRTSTPPRPATFAGRSKSAKKYEGVYASDARAIDDEGLCAFAGCSEPIFGHTFRDHEPVKFQAPVTAEDAIELSEPDTDGDVVDTAKEVLDRAPWTVAPPYDDNDVARLFGDEPELASDLVDEGPGMTDAEAVAAILRAFPGAELVDEEKLGEHDAKPITDSYHCMSCGTRVMPAPASVERGWSTVCRPCAEAGK
jgi:hypothetical protein